ncbi:DUF6020 family protein [Candidatus Enterococcus ferrettii]|uniref:Glycosyltransferase RgtA/B/C/D-like domain-containing protein n=1 Tax=Candidatus Enterococcus ferrettii TaxID=2815324 RepID=A0ABV0EZ04_9ENTE|nr:DUF6020 family protein [Enterococcus sp. 665A]MBO1339867.1 hypothetical protein [Enterococcus sp. 665A]
MSKENKSENSKCSNYNYVVKLFVSLLILASVYFMLPIFNYGRSFNHIFILFLLFTIYLLVNWVFYNYKKKIFIYSGVISFFLAICLVVGEELILYSQTFYSVNTTIKIVLMIVVIICPLYFIFFQLCTLSLERTVNREGVFARTFFVCEITLLFGWGILLLLYYPGIFSYDSQFQVVELYGSQGLSTQHPLIHTFILNMIFIIGDAAGNIQFGAFSVTIFQMIVCSIIVSYSCASMAKEGFSKKWLLLLIGYYAFFPICSIFPIVATKDVLFSFLFMLVVTSLMKWQTRKDIWKLNRTYIELFTLFFITGLFRYNFVYAILIASVIMLIILTMIGKKKIRNFLLLTCLLFAVSISCFNDILINMTSAETRLQGEALSVPLQQLARTFKKKPEVFSSEEKKLLTSFVPDENLAQYNPRISDPIKSKYSSTSGLGNLIVLWARIGAKAPKEYIDAFLMNTQPYWDPNFQYPDQYYKSPPIEMYTRSPQIDRDIYREESMFPNFANSYRDAIVNAELFKKIPLFSLFFNSGFVIWLIVLMLFSNIFKGRCKFIPVFLLIFSYLLTLIMGPVMIVRYALPFFLVWPVLAMYTVHKDSYVKKV